MNDEIYVSDTEIEAMGYEWDTGNGYLLIDGEVIYKILRATPSGLYVREVNNGV